MGAILLAALALAGVIVVAAQGARERRALAAEIRALRDELQHVRQALTVARTPNPTEHHPEEQRTSAPDPLATGHDEADEPSRGPRTLH